MPQHKPDRTASNGPTPLLPQDVAAHYGFPAATGKGERIAIIELGGGRRKVGEALDMAVGLSEVAQLGTALDRERPLAVIHAATEDDAARAEKHLLQACEIGESAPAATPVIHEILTGKN